MRTWKSIGTLSLALAPGIGGCSVIDFQQQEVRVRHDEATDTLRLLLITEGIETPSSDNQVIRSSQPQKNQARRLARALEFTEAMAQGKRRFQTFLFPFPIDLDKWIEEGVDEDNDEFQRACEERIIERAKGIVVEQATAYIDDEGRLAIWQQVRVPQIAAFCELANECVNGLFVRKIQEAAGSEHAARLAHLRAEFEPLDGPSAELWLAHIEQNRAWFGFADGKLQIEVPVTRAFFERQVATFLTELDISEAFQPGDGIQRFGIARVVGSVMMHAETIQFATTGVRLSFAPLDGKALVLRSPQAAAPWRSELLQALRERDFELQKTDVEALRIAFGAP